MTKEELESSLPALLVQLERLNKNLERDIVARESWRLALRNGVAAAVGGLLGTTIMLSLVVRFLQPLNQITSLRPALERLANQQSKK